MGWAILYIAFGLVAVWLLAEVLLQHKARLRWRLLAFVGFLGVVVGVVLPQIIVIGAGLIAFAIGQTQVTLSFRRGFTTGWALGGRPRENRRRRGRPADAPAAEPTLQVSDLEAGPADADAGPGPGADEDRSVFTDTTAFPGQDDSYAGQSPYGSYDSYGPYAEQNAAAASGQDIYGAQSGYEDRSGYAADQSAYARQDPYDATTATPVYAPQPLPDETGAYGIYSPDARAQQQPAPAAYDAYGTAGGDANGYPYDGGYGQNAAPQTPQGGQGGYQDAYADAYADPYAAYGDALAGQGGQAPYSDPYIGAQQYAAPYDPYAQPDPYGQSPYATGQYDPAQNPGQGYGETPPGGVWVPQQREGELPPEQQPYPPYQQQGYDGQQYRY